jgi:CRP-like cAMP-binding protein
MSKISELPQHCQDCPSKGQGIFCNQDDSVLKDICKLKVVNRYKKGQTLFVQGNPVFGIYCVSSGNVKLTQMGSDGKDSILRICKPGDVIGHRSIFSKQKLHATATAIEDAVVCFIEKKSIIDLVQKYPSLSLELLNRLSTELGASEDRLASAHQKDVRQRLAELLLLLLQSHGATDGKERMLLDIRLTREEMSNMIGTATETLIRFLSEFKSLGMIELEGKNIYILDQDKLMEFAGIRPQDT